MKKHLMVMLSLVIGFPFLASSAERIPPVLREMRAVWIATVANIDWPSRPGLSSAEQKKEIITILDRLHDLHMNAVVLQVRPHADAIYKSDLEPWSSYLSGVQGTPPDSPYDPLDFWIRESHARGIELHAWFNPYRASHPALRGPLAPNAFAKTHPECVRRLADTSYYWMDPALKTVQDHSSAVIMDVVKRYDIDGVQLDDYFYPYPEYNNGADFPDNDSYAAYRHSGGTLTREDWRRDAVNKFVERIYRNIKRAKRWVKFGISPFGVCRPGSPEGYGGGFDQYATLYADTKLWWNNGWADYFTPQLYWPISRTQLSYPILLGWWISENTKGRHLWPGLFLTADRGPVGITLETANQIMVTRGMVTTGPGTMLFSMKGLLTPRDSILTVLKEGAFSEPAIVPAFPWLDHAAPHPPVLSCKRKDGSLLIAWRQSGSERAFLYILSVKTEHGWRSDVLPASTLHGSKLIDAGTISAIAISAVDRCGNESKKRIVVLDTDVTPVPSAER